MNTDKTPFDNATFIPATTAINDIERISRAGHVKFGKAIAIVESNETCGYKCVFMRDNSPRPEFPYMGITAFVQMNNTVSFSWGHYDMDKLEAMKWLSGYIHTGKTSYR